MSYGNICNLCRGYTANEQTMCEEVGATSWKNVCKCVCHMAKAEEGKEPPIKKHRDTCHHKSGPNADKEHLWDYANDLRCRCICTCPQPIEESPSPNCSCGLIIMGNTLKHRKDCALNRVEKPVEHEFDCPKQKCGGNPTCPNHDCTCKKPVEECWKCKVCTFWARVPEYPCPCDCHKKPEPQNKADWEEIDINKTGYAGLDLPLSWEEKVRQMLREIDRAEIDDSRLYELIRQTILSERKAEREEIVKLVEKKKKKEKLGKYCKNCGEEIGYDRAQGLYFCGTCPFTSSEAKEDLVKMEFSEYNQTLDDLLAFLREEE